MKALVTGASSGIGRDIARQLHAAGHEIYAVARRSDKLEELKNELKTNIHTITADLGNHDECISLYESLKGENIDILVNNAGFGTFGRFCEIPKEKELEMININIVAFHTLTKLFLNDFREKNKGYILNVASSAGFMIGPLLATYYATKAYVLRLSEAISCELKKEGSKVKISVLCPGPVKTEFDKVANVRFSLKGLTSDYVAKYAVKRMFKGKTVIIPGFKMKTAIFFSRFIPEKLLANITYHCQHKKEG